MNLLSVIKTLQTRITGLEAERSAYKRRAESAEAKLRELEMQEPLAYISQNDWGMPELMWNPTNKFKYAATVIKNPDTPLYTKPFPAPKQEEK